MHRLTLSLALCAAALVLSACGGPPAAAGRFRNPALPIWSNAVTDPAALRGRWTQVATFSTAGAAACGPGYADFQPDRTRVQARVKLCLNGGTASYRGPLALAGPGRLQPVNRADAPLDRPWWVLWVDVDIRTLVLGTPDGSFAVVLNREARLPPDRLQAARDVLGWNGYDLNYLRGF